MLTNWTEDLRDFVSIINNKQSEVLAEMFETFLFPDIKSLGCRELYSPN